MCSSKYGPTVNFLFYLNATCNYYKEVEHFKRDWYKLQDRLNLVEEVPLEFDSYAFKRLSVRDEEDEDDDYPYMMISSISFSTPCLVSVCRRHSFKHGDRCRCCSNRHMLSGIIQKTL